MLLSGYGLTETAPVLSTARLKPVRWAGEGRYATQAMTGYAIPGVELRVIDFNEQGCAPRRQDHGRNYRSQ